MILQKQHEKTVEKTNAIFLLQNLCVKRMPKTAEQPKVLKNWPVYSVQTDTGELDTVKLYVFSGEGSPSIQRPDFTPMALTPRIPVNLEGFRCMSLRDVVVKHTLELCQPDRGIPKKDLLEKAEEVAVRAAYAYALKTHSQARGAGLIVHIKKVLGFSDTENVRSAGERYGCLKLDKPVVGSLHEFYDEITPTVMGNLGRLPGAMRKNEEQNVVSKLKNLARITVICASWENAPNIEQTIHTLGSTYSSIKTALLEGKKLGLVSEEKTDKKKKLEIDFTPDFIKELMARVRHLVDEVALDGSENKLKVADHIGYRVVAELTDFLSGGSPAIGVKIAGLKNVDKHTKKSRALGLSIGDVNAQTLGIDMKGIRVIGIPENHTLFEAAGIWAVEHMIERAMGEENNVKARAAQRLGVTQTTLNDRMIRLEKTK